MANFDYKSALDAGYSEDEIKDYLSSTQKDFDVKGALDAGYTLDEVSNYISNPEQKKAEHSTLEKGARVAAQYGLGAIEGSVPGLVYDVAVSPINSKPFAENQQRQRIGEDVEFLLESNAGKPIEEWSEQDRKLYESFEEQIKPGGELKDVQVGPDLSIRGLAEKITGVDLKPEGIAEKAAQWAGFIKDPRKIFELRKTGLSPKELIKSISPSGKEALRGLGAGTALQLAEEGNFGPIGTLAAAVVGDIGGNIAAGGGKALAKIVSNPREALAEASSKFTGKDKLDLQKQIIKDFRDANIQADIGTITNNDLVKWVQSRLAQSGLTGNALGELKDTVTKQIKDEYKTLADAIGEERFLTSHQAGETAKGFMKSIRDAELAEVRELYKKADERLKDTSFVDSKKLFDEVIRIESSLNPGQLKSGEQTAVLNILETIKRDISDSTGRPIYAKVKDLMNDKIALNDIINYEVQGGSKQLLKGIVSELDRAIISHGKNDTAFAKNYITANKRFSNHAKTFRNKRVKEFFGEGDPAQILNKMNTVQGIRDLENILKGSATGEETMKSLRRFKLDRMIGDNLVDSTTQQLKLGTFSKLLEKGKNRDIARELLPRETFKKLTNLQKNAGRLAESAQKFLNTSKSGITIEDAGIVSKALWDIGNLISGNPWPFIRTAGGLGAARYVTKLMADPEFLKLVEEFVLAAEKNNSDKMNKIAQGMLPLIQVALQQSNKESG